MITSRNEARKAIINNAIVVFQSLLLSPLLLEKKYVTHRKTNARVLTTS
jgi:hypothetical protein